MHIYPKQVDSELCQQDHICEQCCIKVILYWTGQYNVYNLINRTKKP